MACLCLTCCIGSHIYLAGFATWVLLVKDRVIKFITVSAWRSVDFTLFCLVGPIPYSLEYVCYDCLLTLTTVGFLFYGSLEWAAVQVVAIKFYLIKQNSRQQHINDITSTVGPRTM